MHRRHLLAAGAALAVPGFARAAEPLVLRARDGASVYAERVPATGRRRGIILLFHMAGSNRGEYAPIAPELARLGWDSIAIDQRSGGALWGRGNETARRLGTESDYLAALPDLEAALAHAVATGGGAKVLVWGSSYSAALVFLLAAAHPQDVGGVLAFSPGEYIEGRSIRGAAAKLACPVFVTSANDPGEVSAARDIIAASPSRLKRQFVPRNGTHGSATLRQDSNPRGQAECWQAVRGFLESAA